MKRALLLVSSVILLTSSLFSQKVDSIKIEQSGDFIKIRYRILNSTPDQLFRIKIVYAVNGGLNIEPRSITGDVGDNIVGGKSEYFAVWDVLKDVDELTSAEFKVSAELISDLASRTAVSQNSKKIFGKYKAFVFVVSEFPGPKIGLRIGYLGNFGIAGRLASGKVSLTDEYKSLFTDDRTSRILLSIELSKRIINGKNFQMHIIAGLESSDVYYYWTGGSTPEFWFEGAKGFDAGLIFGYKHLGGSLMISRVNAKKKEDTNLAPASPAIYLNAGVGIRF